MKIKTSLLMLAAIWQLGIVAPAGADDSVVHPGVTTPASKIETFTFSSDGVATKAKIYLPASYERNRNLPAIYLIDFTEQHFKVATDEFEKVIEGVQQIQHFDALVVTLESIPDIDAEPDSFHEHYQLAKDMASYVDGNYTDNNSRTLIGKGSESGIVLMALLQDNPSDEVFDNFIATDPSGRYAKAVIELLEMGYSPENKSNKKLHFSFSTTNDRERVMKLIRLINEAQYPWLQFHSVEYADSDYENTYPISFADGIKFIFEK